jgi:hypothetical protein
LVDVGIDARSWSYGSNKDVVELLLIELRMKELSATAHVRKVAFLAVGMHGTDGRPACAKAMEKLSLVEGAPKERPRKRNEICSTGILAFTFSGLAKMSSESVRQMNVNSRK